MLFTCIEQITIFIKEQIASVIDQSPDTLDEDVNFLKFGISSIQTIMIINKIRKKLNIDLNPIAMFEYKNIKELGNYLKSCLAETLPESGTN